MAKYDPLKQYLLNLPPDKNDITLTFDQIGKIIIRNLPQSAYIHRAWWSNEAHGIHVSAHAWMDAGWRVDAVNQSEHWVRFIRIRRDVQPKPRTLIPNRDTQHTVIGVKRTMFTANRPVRTLVVHKPECRVIPWDKLNLCGCGDRGELGNQRWFCEEHITIQDVNKFMKGRFWSILLCDLCF